MELINYNDFKSNENKVVYGVKYSPYLDKGILPFAEYIASHDDFNPEELFKETPNTAEFIILKKTDIVAENRLYIEFTINPNYEKGWQDLNIPYNIYKECKDNNAVYACIYKVDEPNNNDESCGTQIGRNRDIYLFTTKEECDNYIKKCNKVILENLMNYYKTKILQYTSTVNKITSKFADIL